MNINEKLQHEDGAEMADPGRFRSLVGGLIYLTHTQLNISFPVGVISKFMQQPSKVHYGAAKWVLCYIVELWSMEFGSGVITWSSKKQATVALSTSEAEYIVATSAACQTIWLRRLLVNLQQEQKGATEIFCDNKTTISMTKNPTFHSRTKHIELRHYFIRDLVAKEEIALKYRSTNEQLADILTKALSKEKFCYFRGLLGVCNFESRGSVEM
ncbi:hypothetical protein GH714_022406 [Hevea brasiliensis]|uniref:Reverse transcriptase Ty1/copia-type domain-containing protein n=1 Tax=Hevea brasiliensis TaxID=3981 RepID=A0A6A6MUB3_HEVBR|nr:hypothetical protein GH714_022406 [Hevea brasiliensis]